jgi:glutathione S-transferase
MQLFYAETIMPRKACAVARLLGSPVDYVYVDFGKGENRSPQFRAMNPNRKAPVLVDGDRTLWESNAIMCHLARRAGSDIWPGDDRQPDVIRWLSWDAEHFTRNGAVLYFEHVIKPKYGLPPGEPATLAEALKGWRHFARVLDQHLQDQPFLTGETLTIADFAVAVVLPYAEQAQLPLSEFAHVAAWSTRLDAIDAWRDPFPHRQT